MYLELEYSGFIPDAYIAEPMEKMEMYKRIASVTTRGRSWAGCTGRSRTVSAPCPRRCPACSRSPRSASCAGSLFIVSVREKTDGLARVEFSRLSQVSVDSVLRLVRESGGSVSLDPARHHA